MSGFADLSKSQMGGVALAAVSYMQSCLWSRVLSSGEMMPGSNGCFHTGISKIKSFWLIFSRLKLVLKGARVVLTHALVAAGFLLAGGCQFGEPKYVGGNLGGVNHTFDAINYFAVNGYGGKNLQPNGFGGGACCVVLPRKWPIGLKALVEWEVDPNPRALLPPHWSDEYKAAYIKHREGYRRYRAVVDIPEYTIEGLCSLKIHFLPCNQLKATTSCAMYGSPDYPIKELQKMKEPSVCSKAGDA